MEWKNGFRYKQSKQLLKPQIQVMVKNNVNFLLWLREFNQPATVLVAEL